MAEGWSETRSRAEEVIATVTAAIPSSRGGPSSLSTRIANIIAAFGAEHYTFSSPLVFWPFSSKIRSGSRS